VLTWFEILSGYMIPVRFADVSRLFPLFSDGFPSFRRLTPRKSGTRGSASSTPTSTASLLSWPTRCVSSLSTLSAILTCSPPLPTSNQQFKRITITCDGDYITPNSLDGSLPQYPNTLGPSQVCSLPGATAGSNIIAGEDYLAAAYEYYVKDQVSSTLLRSPSNTC
jgi:hypothetical protein